MTLNVKRHALTDGSHVFEVQIGNSISFAATNENDAALLAQKIANAVREHTIEDADVRYDY